MAKKKGKCGKCMFRAGEYEPFACDHVYLTGRTRKAQDPEKCTYFRKGPRLQKPVESVPLIGSTTRRQSKFDWKKSRELYDAGKNDQEIADVLGCSSNSVFSWRKENGLPANAARGWYKGRARKTGGCTHDDG